MTFKQFIICGGGGGIAYAIYVSLSAIYYWEVWLLPVAFVSLLTLAIAFVKIHEIPFYKYILLLIEFYILPKKRIWVQGSGEVSRPLFEPPQKPKKKGEEAPVKKEKKITDVSEILKRIEKK